MHTRQHHHSCCIPLMLAAFIAASALGSGRAAAQFIITEIIDTTGDGEGHSLFSPTGIAVDVAGNAYVAGKGSNNAFRITPGGDITVIIDETGDGDGNTLRNYLKTLNRLYQSSEQAN